MPFLQTLSNNQDEKKKLLSMSEISLILDTYDDIFSDFDPRPYSERALSEDFLDENKRAIRGKDFGKFQLKFLIPKEKRNISSEKLIKKRLREHFKKHFEILKNQKKKIIKKGLIFTIFGIVVMFFTSFFLYKRIDTNYLVNFLVVLFEPAGWFLFWEGLNQSLFESKRINPNLHYYSKMVNSEIDFLEV